MLFELCAHDFSVRVLHFGVCVFTIECQFLKAKVKSNRLVHNYLLDGNAFRGESSDVMTSSSSSRPITIADSFVNPYVAEQDQLIRQARQLRTLPHKIDSIIV